MKKSPTGENAPKPRQPAARRAAPSGSGLQPPPTGANKGSPAAPVMKQFAKTKAESTGRS